MADGEEELPLALVGINRSMADEEVELPLALVEEHILVRLDVKDLLRFKSVCKSWRSLISTPRFVKAHLNRSYLNDRNNHHLGHRRIQCPLQPERLTTDTWFSFADHSVVVGSCNGLVCVSPRACNEFVVTNPSTREVKNLPTPPLMPRDKDGECWGFGYDLATDDYKVILSFRKDMSATRFYVLTLRSNTWKLIEEAVNHKCTMLDTMGVFCDGALHWFIEDAHQNEAIMSFDLSTEEFKTIPLPTAEEEEYKCDDYRLGIIEEYLCMYHTQMPMSKKIWVMRSNRWEVYNHDFDPESSIKYDVVHRLTRVSHMADYYTSQTTGSLNTHVGKLKRRPKNITYVYGLGDGRPMLGIGVYSHDDRMTGNLGGNIFVKSLVSPNSHPHVNNNNSHNSAKQQGQEDNGSVESRGEGSSLRKRNRSV